VALLDVRMPEIDGLRLLRELCAEGSPVRTRFFAQLSQHFTDLSVEPREFIDAGDTVAVVACISATGSAGSVQVDSLHLCWLRDRRAVSFTEYTDTARTLQATES
jgi:ketosteroid isomerase-like protein